MKPCSVLAAAASILCGLAQGQIALPVRATHGAILKAENGLIFHWTANSTDRGANQVDVVENAGKHIISLNVLAPVDGAKRVSVHDVSAMPDQFIAVSAVYVNASNTPAAALLYFNWNGDLEHFIALDPTREAWCVAVDRRGTVWTMTTHSGDLNPAAVPLIVQYDSAGNLIRELLPRSEFPYHAAGLRESPGTGSVGFGIAGNDLWFWMPVSGDFVTVNTANYVINRTAVPLPGSDAQGEKLVLLKLAALPDDSLLAEFRAEDSPTRAHLEWKKRTQADKTWRDIACQNCSGMRLIGASEYRLAYEALPARTVIYKNIVGSLIE